MTAATPAPKLQVEHLKAWFRSVLALKDVSLRVMSRSVLAVIGPSGCGKSTFLRCLNRMHELTPGARSEGRLLLDGDDLYANGVDPVHLRRRVGMVFQRPNPFPTMSVYENVAAGLKLNHMPGNHAEIVERCLRQAALWDEVKDRQRESALGLSGGQQQRLCIARALAVEPEVLLMDEPASALDPIATAKIEDLIHELKERYTIVIVTHNMQQAARVSDDTAFFYMGELIEVGPTEQIFTNPRESRTEDYVTGKFGEGMAPATHTDKAYEAELHHLRDRLLEMGGKVEAAISASVRALSERDTELAQKVKLNDREVNRLEVEIDDACRRILALRQPAASDLRFITTALKIVTDLERMGDLAVNIAERAIDLNQAPPLRPFHDLSTLADLSEAQLKKALDAFVERDVQKAEGVMKGDELLDALYLKLFNELLTYMMEDSRAIRRATSIMFAAKHLERFGDHAMNVAEMVIYMVRGTDVRHPRSRE